MDDIAKTFGGGQTTANLIDIEGGQQIDSSTQRLDPSELNDRE